VTGLDESSFVPFMRVAVKVTDWPTLGFLVGETSSVVCVVVAAATVVVVVRPTAVNAEATITIISNNATSFCFTRYTSL